MTNSTERLTWREIEERYPDTRVGLNDVVFEKDNDAAIVTAVVTEYGDKCDVFDSQFAHRVKLVLYTTPDNFPQNWHFDPISIGVAASPRSTSNRSPARSGTNKHLFELELE